MYIVYVIKKIIELRINVFQKYDDVATMPTFAYIDMFQNLKFKQKMIVSLLL